MPSPPQSAVSSSREGSPLAGGALGPGGRRFPGLRGVCGRAFVDLGPHLDLGPLAEIHEEICLALAQVPLDYTGGSHRSMGIMPRSRVADAHADYGEVIRAMSADQFETFRSLADDPASIDPRARESLEFGEERAVPLSRRQMRWLEARFAVYFPWKGYVELIPNRYWADKANPNDKAFTRVARAFFPKTVAFVERLPFVHVGRCNVMGLASFDHGTVHRDADPTEKHDPDHFISFVPGGQKRLFLWDDTLEEELVVDARAYWFNDCDFHGVAPAPFFRYSVRVDGVFEQSFLDRIQGGAS